MSSQPDFFVAGYPLSRMRLVDTFTQQQLVKLTREIDADIWGLACGRDGNCVFAADYQNKNVKKIDIDCSQATNVHTCAEGYYPQDLVWLNPLSQKNQELALLSEFYFPPKLKVEVLEEGRTGLLAVKQSVAFDIPSSGVGRIAALQNGTIMICATGLNAVHVWKRGKEKTFPLLIPHNKSQIAGLCILPASTGGTELLALSFDDDNSVDVFRICAKLLEHDHHITFPFSPHHLLWIASRKTLLICPNNSEEYVYALRLWESTHDERVDLRAEARYISCWCVQADPTGVDGVMLYDRNNKHIKKLVLE